jgi:hypothetical protein
VRRQGGKDGGNRGQGTDDAFAALREILHYVQEEWLVGGRRWWWSVAPDHGRPVGWDLVAGASSRDGDHENAIRDRDCEMSHATVKLRKDPIKGSVMLVFHNRRFLRRSIVTEPVDRRTDKSRPFSGPGKRHCNSV